MPPDGKVLVSFSKQSRDSPKHQLAVGRLFAEYKQLDSVHSVLKAVDLKGSDLTLQYTLSFPQLSLQSPWPAVPVCVKVCVCVRMCVCGCGCGVRVGVRARVHVFAVCVFELLTSKYMYVLDL